MPIEAIKAQIEALAYPGLEKRLGELDLISNVELEEGVLSITLKINNVDAFRAIDKEIRALFKESHPDISVFRESGSSKRDISYGTTHTPNNRAPYAKRVIAVTSGKGGVGKSTVCANLSVALAQEGFSVGILDADVYGPNIPRLLGVMDEKLAWNDANKMVPSENFGVKIMSVASTTPAPDTPLVWRSSVAVSALIQFLEDVAWGELDFLVIDMPPGTGDVQLTMAQELPITAAVVVTTPQAVCMDDVSRAIMMFKETGVRIGGLVENMSYFIAPDTKTCYDIFGRDGGKKLSQKYNVPLLGEIPLLIEIREMGDSGTVPVAVANEEIRGYYKNIVKNLLKQVL